MPSVHTLGITALVIYLLGLVVIVEAARRAKVDLSPADHYLAGRGLGTFVLFMTLYATAYSGNSLLGYPGEAYRRGFSWIMATGFMMSIIVAFHLLVPRLRPLAVRHRFVSPGDWIRHRFRQDPGASVLVVAVGILMSVALANFLLAQLTAMGLVASQITGGAVPYWAGVAGLAGVIVVYETIGGMRAVAWTDAIQSSLMLFGLGILLLWLLREAGGFAGMTHAISEVRPDAVALPDSRQCVNWVSTTLLMAFASIVYPQAIQRIYAAADGRTLRRSLGLMSFMPLATTLVVTLIGLAAIARFEGLGEIEADTVMPRLLEELARAGPGAAILVTAIFLAALAAIMSTADSVLLALGSVVTEDVFGRSGRGEATTRAGKRVAVGIMLVASLIALEPRLTLWRLIELKMELLIQCAPAFVLALHWKRLRAMPVLAGLVVGAAVSLGAALFEVRQLGGLHVGLIGLGLNLMVLSGVALWKSPAETTADQGLKPS